MQHLPKYVDEKSLDAKLRKVRDFYNKKYTQLGTGSYRRTFDLGNGTVAKIPGEFSLDCMENTGISANLIEYAIYMKFKKTGIFAKTSLIWKYGIPVLIMDKVQREEPDLKYKTKIEKAKLCFNDGYYQCGQDSTGRVVCFDFGNEFYYLKNMSNQVFIGMIPEAHVNDLLNAARDVNVSNDVFICNEAIKDEDTGDVLEDHLTIYTTKPELSKKLWERYEFYVAWAGFDLEQEKNGMGIK